MSTYGKKSLVYWDYSNVDIKRFLKSPKGLQLDILQKWYPIGEKCQYYKMFSYKLSDATINDYNEYNSFYSVVLLSVGDRSGIEKINTNINRLKLTAFERDIKLRRVLNNI